MIDPIEKKWNNIYEQTVNMDLSTAWVLAEHRFLLPKSGDALDLACGLGGNALFLADCGLNTEAWDLSTVAIEKLQQTAQSKSLKITTRICSIEKNSFFDCAFDVIVVSRFLDRSVCDGILKVLKPGGLLFYQTYTREKASSEGPKNPDYLLEKNELLSLFGSLTVVFYRENGLVGDITSGFRNEACYIGQKI